VRTLRLRNRQRHGICAYPTDVWTSCANVHEKLIQALQIRRGEKVNEWARFAPTYVSSTESTLKAKTNKHVLYRSRL